MSDLSTVFATLVRHHIATPSQPLPPASPGITWIWAANGIFKRGVDRALSALIQVKAWPATDVMGLASLVPYVRWQHWPRRLPGQLLGPILENARRAASGSGLVLRPIEKHYCFVWRDETIRVVAPPQRGTAGRVDYVPPERGVTLLDLHSHHQLPAYFSATDDADDRGLSVSAVMGHIFTRPELLVRINVYGHREIVPPLIIFDQTGPLSAKEERYAAAAD